VDLNKAQTIFKQVPTLVRVSPIGVVTQKGDASGRKYHRVNLSDGTSLIIMELASEVGPVAGGGVTLTQDETYLLLEDLYRKNNVPCPKIIAELKPEKILIIEDVGDVSLMRCLNEPKAQDVEAALSSFGEDPLSEAFRRSIDLLVKLQAVSKSDHVAFKRFYGAEEYFAESFRFITFFAEPNQCASIVKQKIEQEIRDLCEKVATHPRTLCHRDYMSWNIHLRSDGSPVIIDFQDTLLGSVAYDLATLLTDRDADSDLGPERVGKLFEYGKKVLQLNDTTTMIDEVIAQRNIRLVGQFTRLSNEKSKHYAAFIPGCLKRSVAVLTRLGIAPTLAQYLKEFSK